VTTSLLSPTSPTRLDDLSEDERNEAFDRLRIQEGFSYAYTPKVMSAWVTDVPNMNQRSVSLAYRFLVAMQGALGVGSNLNKFTEQDTATAAQMIATYKRIRPTIQTGDLYRIASPRTEDVTVNQYVSTDGKQSVLFAFRHAQQYRTDPPVIRLRGLDAQAVYKLESVVNRMGQGQQQEYSGAWLMQNGLALTLRGDYDATAIILERQ